MRVGDLAIFLFVAVHGAMAINAAPVEIFLTRMAETRFMHGQPLNR
jgi:hypothetical protein